MFSFSKFFKAIFNSRKNIEDNPMYHIMQEHNEKLREFLSYDAAQMAELSDYDLYEAARERASHIVFSHEDILEGVEALTEPQRIVFVTSYFEMEVNNGGLCQFFVNSSREIAPMVSECLSAVGALEHKKLYDSFIAENKIDPNDLSSFKISSIFAFQKQAERYPFDDFDLAFYALPSIEEISYPYVRDHVDEL